MSIGFIPAAVKGILHVLLQGQLVGVHLCIGINALSIIFVIPAIIIFFTFR